MSLEWGRSGGRDYVKLEVCLKHPSGGVEDTVWYKRRRVWERVLV